MHHRSLDRIGRPLTTWPCAVITGILSLTTTAQAQVSEQLLPRNLSPWGMFLSADIVVKAVMVGLAFASLVTWTVWLGKTVELRHDVGRARKRLKLLQTDAGLAEVVRACGNDSDAVARLAQA